MISPTVVAQLIPPAAFQATNRGHGIRLAPASQEAHTRRPRIQRPKNTALAPWRSIISVPRSSTARRCFSKRPGRSSSQRPPLRPIR